MELKLQTPVQYMHRVGPFMADKLAHCGIVTLYDLLYYLPFRYEDYTHMLTIGHLHAREVGTMVGTIASIHSFATKTGKKMQEANITNNTGQSIKAIWFNQPYLLYTMKKGETYAFAGTIDFFGTSLVLQTPIFEQIEPSEAPAYRGKIIPIYSETKGLTSKWIHARIEAIFPQIEKYIAEYLPDALIQKSHLITLLQALRSVHFPSSLQEAERGKRRLAIDELIYLQALAFEQKRVWNETKKSKPLSLSSEDRDSFIHSLPFILTGDQTQALTDILTDMTATIPMNRLLEGDVGSGKTVVATGALFAAVKNGYSALCMAPTQILAEQHYRTIQSLLKPFHVSVELVMGGSKTKKIVYGDTPCIYVGTHALLEESQQWNNIGLVIIDEQQRFGVRARATLEQKSHDTHSPHVLTMTATPIPRTLALTKYKNLQLSILKTMPIGRKEVKTWLVSEEKRTGAYAWMTKQIQENHAQIFIICPFIEESENATTVKAATIEFERLSKHIFPTQSLLLLHGKMSAKDKTSILTAFQERKADILVSTPIVEVGVDIPGATIMVIEGAERFGLSQLHQLRGRVGRNDMQSYCILFAQTQGEQTKKRLATIEKVHDGATLAEYDLTLRGPGDMFGIRQHGLSQIAVEAYKDPTLLKEAEQITGILTTSDPTFISFPLLRERLNKSKIENISNN